MDAVDELEMPHEPVEIFSPPSGDFVCVGKSQCPAVL